MNMRIGITTIRTSKANFMSSPSDDEARFVEDSEGVEGDGEEDSEEDAEDEKGVLYEESFSLLF